MAGAPSLQVDSSLVYLDSGGEIGDPRPASQPPRKKGSVYTIEPRHGHLLQKAAHSFATSHRTSPSSSVQFWKGSKQDEKLKRNLETIRKAQVARNAYRNHIQDEADLLRDVRLSGKISDEDFMQERSADAVSLREAGVSPVFWEKRQAQAR